MLENRLLREAEAASALGLAVSTLRRWRWAGRGPVFVKLGRAVRYDPVELAAFIGANQRLSTRSPETPGSQARTPRRRPPRRRQTRSNA